MRIGLGIPVVGGVPGEVYGSHLRLAGEISRVGDVVALTPCNMFPHDVPRNFIIREALELDCTYLLMVDSDMSVPKGAFETLLNTLMTFHVQMTVAYCPRRGYPYSTTWFKVIDDRTHAIELTEEPVELDSCGMACNLIDLRWLRENLKEPYYFLGQVQGLGMIWEDAYFCMQLRNAGGKIIGDPSVKCGHLGAPQLVTHDNANLLRKQHLEQQEFED